MSERDELTQIKNRRGFMEQAMKMNRIYKNRKAIILFADMDGLKQINDNYGHAAGDIAICACADILKKAAGVNGIAGTLGGDEFALMMIGDETRAIELMETVQKEIAMYNAQEKISAGTLSEKSWRKRLKWVSQMLYAADRGSSDSRILRCTSGSFIKL